MRQQYQVRIISKHATGLYDVIVDAAVGMAKFRGEYHGRLPSLGCPGCNGDTLEYVDD